MSSLFRPMIGITCAGKTDLPRHPELYILAVEKAGGSALYISPDSGMSDKPDGYIIPGGLDIAPELYGEERSCAMNPEKRERTDFEIELAGRTTGQGKPLLGICYGMQLINVCLKGNLYQDIHSQRSGTLRHDGGPHGILISGNPYIAAGERQVNSSHHQAVRNLGYNLRAVACSPDGIVEAFCGEGSGYLLGVQWHPERMKDELSESIFGSFIEACNAAQGRK